MMHRRLTVAAVALLAAACSAPNNGVPAQPTDTTLVPVFDGRLRAPRGFSVAYFAQNLPGVRMMARGPGGVVYATLPGQRRVVRLPDANGDGAADATETAIEGAAIGNVSGIAFRGDTMYLANSSRLLRTRVGADGRATGPLDTLAAFSGSGGHSTRTVVVGADGALYVSIGSSCNICEESFPDRAAVMRYNTDGSGGRVFARGLRNAVGVAVYPPTGAIWVSQHERDNIQPDHENLPPEEINILEDGGDYGWPFCHSDRVPNPEYNDAARCASTIPPALQMQAHSAPNGMTFLDRATTFPADFRDDALVAFHGSWNRDVPTGAKVVRIEIREGRPAGYSDFVAGWQRDDGSRWGRPVDVLVASDGSVLISDDQGDAIFRVWR